jgi:hypothetical protein
MAYTSNNSLSSFLSGVSPTTVSKQTASYLNDVELDRLSDQLSAMFDDMTTGINMRYPNSAPQGSWFLREGNSAGKIAVDRMIYVQMLRLRDTASDVLCFGGLDERQYEALGHVVTTILWLHDIMARELSLDDANNSIGRSLKSAAYGVKQATEEQKALIFGQMVDWLSKEWTGEVRLYESATTSPINAIVSEVQRFESLLRWFSGLDTLAISRIDASKRPEQLTVAGAIAVAQFNIKTLQEAAQRGLDIHDPVKELTTDPIAESVTPSDDSNDIAREAYDKRLGAELAAAFGGVFADTQFGGTPPPMH